MRSIRWVGLVYCLVIVGVLGGLMAPLPSQADPPMPTLTIDGVTINNLIYYGDGCGTGTTPAARQAAPFDTAYNACWSIPNASGGVLFISPSLVTTEAQRTGGRLVGQWYISSYSSTNKARVLIYDVSSGSNPDGMKLSGTSITPTAGGAATRITDVILINTFNQPDGGNLKGNYSWAMSQGGHIDPFPNTETMVGSGVRLSGTIQKVDNTNIGNGDLGFLEKYNPLAGPTGPANINGSLTESKASTKVKNNDNVTNAICHTNTVTRNGVPVDLCAPKITLTWHVTIKGLDRFNLTDSLVGCPGSCNAGEEPICDPSEGEEGGLGCLPSCEQILAICDGDGEAPGIIPTSVQADVDEGIAVGAVEACGAAGGCILNMVKATPAKIGAALTVPFIADGPGVVSPFSVLTNADGIGGHNTKDLATGHNVGTRTFTPTTPSGWELDGVSCVSSLIPTTSKWKKIGSSFKTGLEVRELGVGDTLTCTWHFRK
jgi:hypothetical protein